MLVSRKMPFEHGGNVYEAVSQKGCVFSELLDFSANINPLGIAATVFQALEEGLKDIIHYPDPGAVALKKAINHCYGAATECITTGNGAVELMYVLCHVLRPRRVLVAAPSFSEYERAACSAGARVEYLYLSPEDGFHINIDALATLMKNVDIVFVGNPNNPTGRFLVRSEMEQLLKVGQVNNTILVVDESFMDFLPDDDRFTCRPLVSRYDNLIILHSLTKFYAIPGLRLGFSLASPDLTRRMHEGKDPWNVNSLAQRAGVVALGDKTYRDTSRAFMAEAKEKLYVQLATLPGFNPYPPGVNFILADIAGTGMNAGQMRHRMATQGILIRDCSNYPGLSPDYIRLAVKLPWQNELLIQKIRKMMGDV